jgi:hypothetical protein
MALIPGWTYNPLFTKGYSRSTVKLADLTEMTDSPVELLKRNGPRMYPSTSQLWVIAK